MYILGNTSQFSGTKSKFSILTTSKLSIKDVKEKLNPLRDPKIYLQGQDTARPIMSEDILEKVGEEDENSEEDLDILSLPQQKIVEESFQKETESLDHLKTEEDIIKRKIHNAVK